MREYSLFIIKKNHYTKNSSYLFNILCVIKNNKTYGKYLFEQICEFYDADILNNYLNEKYNLNKKYVFYFEDIFLKICRTRIIVRSKYNFPKLIRFLNYYNKYIFVVDFNNGDYFWLNDIAHEKVLI